MVTRHAGVDELPAWFSFGLYAALVWCATVGMSALILLWWGKYHPVTCSVIATGATAAAWPFRPRRRASARPALGPAIAAVAIALALLSLAGAAHSEHLFTDRDPSVYINTGRSVAGIGHTRYSCRGRSTTAVHSQASPSASPSDPTAATRIS